MGSFQPPLERAITGMSERQGPIDAGELDGEHQACAEPGAMLGKAFLEISLGTEADVMTGMVIR